MGIAAILKSFDALGLIFSSKISEQSTMWEHQALPDRTQFWGRVDRRLCRMFSIPHPGTLRIDAIKSTQLEHQVLKMGAESR